MKLRYEFLSKLKLPDTAWSYEAINDKLCYVIHDRVYANVFWVHLWYNVLAEKFFKQNIVSSIASVDLELPVIIVEDTLELISVQPIIKTFVYYSELHDKDLPPLFLNVSASVIMTIYGILFVLIVVLSYKYAPKNLMTVV